MNNDVYKYCGCTIKLFEALDDEVVNNSKGHKQFLESYIDDENTTKVIDVIKNKL